MSRIRSIHPSLFTDEAYMGLSMAAKAAWPGIWTECDDRGVFEWKPIVLKARLFPADNVDMEAILSELERAGMVRREEVDGHLYGLVRNFCKFQKPKKPTYKFAFKDEWRPFLALPPSGGEPVPHQFPTGTEESSLMEMEMEEGVRKEERKQDPSPPARGRYFFESGIIRLNERDFRQWERSFSKLDLRAELIALSDWADKQANWFVAVANALAKRNREVGIRIAQGPPPASAVNAGWDPRL